MLIGEKKKKKNSSQTLTEDCCCVKGQFFQDALPESSLDEMEIEILRNKLQKVKIESLGSKFLNFPCFLFKVELRF